MEIINNILIIRSRKVFERLDTVVVISAYKDFYLRCDLSYSSDALVGNIVPFFAILFFGNFVKKLKSKHICVLTKSLRKLLPELIESVLIFYIVKKAWFILTVIKAVTKCLMKIKNHVKSKLLTSFDCSLYICETILYIVSGFILNKFIVNGNSDVIESPWLYYLKIIFRNEIIISFLSVIALWKPSPKVNSMHIAFEFFHFVTSTMFLLPQFLTLVYNTIAMWF